MTNGTIPGYIPEHLRGKVDSFRQEPDGRISFRHDAAGLGEFGDTPGGGRKFVTPEQYKMTFDSDYRVKNLAKSMEGQYGVDRYPTSFGRMANEAIGGKIRDALDWGTSSQGKSTATAGLLSALTGGIGGTIWAARNGEENPVKKGLLMALLSGVAGTGAAALLADRSNRRAAFEAERRATMAKQASSVSDETAYLRSVVLGDSRLSSAEKADILKALARMRDGEREELADNARKLFGFGAGMYIARVLFSKGLIPSVIGGMIGAAMLSSDKRSKPKMNPWGQLSS